MKAYRVYDKDGVCDYTIIVFAENRNQARYIALHSEAFEWYDCLTYIDLIAKRIPALDKYYRGLDEMDWDNTEDRIAMVKEANFSCSDEYALDECGCEYCPAKQWCERYECEIAELAEVAE